MAPFRKSASIGDSTHWMSAWWCGRKKADLSFLSSTGHIFVMAPAMSIFSGLRVSTILEMPRLRYFAISLTTAKAFADPGITTSRNASNLKDTAAKVRETDLAYVPNLLWRVTS